MQNAAPRGLALVHAAQVSDAPISMIVARTSRQRDTADTMPGEDWMDRSRQRWSAAGRGEFDVDEFAEEAVLDTVGPEE
jgi:hypothetical protein